VVSSLDKPGSPAGEAKQDFHNRRFGRDHAQRMAFRRAVLDVSLDDLQRVGETYLQPEKASIAVVTGTSGHAAEARTIEELGLAVRELQGKATARP
jgi:Zn-dependent M16 (insulinase) family peptidase